MSGPSSATAGASTTSKCTRSTPCAPFRAAWSTSRAVSPAIRRDTPPCTLHQRTSAGVPGSRRSSLAESPRRPCLGLQSMVLSASQDESVRCWNIRTGVLALVFGGEEGHRNEVLTCDWHPWRPCTVVSAGMDNIIKVWEADGSYLDTFNQALGPWAKRPGSVRLQTVGRRSRGLGVAPLLRCAADDPKRKRLARASCVEQPGRPQSVCPASASVSCCPPCAPPACR